MSGEPTSALICALVGSGLYALDNAARGNDGKAVRGLAAGAVFGAICVGLDEATTSPVGTALAALFLFGAIMSHGANAITLAVGLIGEISGSSKAK